MKNMYAILRVCVRNIGYRIKISFLFTCIYLELTVWTPYHPSIEIILVLAMYG